MEPAHPMDPHVADHGVPPFFLQAGSPSSLAVLDPDALDLSLASQRVFPWVTEPLVMFWHGAPVALSYKYDVSVMLEDVICLVGEVSCSAEGFRALEWANSGFFARWILRWGAGRIQVVHEWMDPHEARPEAAFALEALRRPVALPVVDFLAEWRRPLEIVSAALLDAGYGAEDLTRLPALDQAIARTGRRGWLYQPV
jgi:hypothetical protein